MWRSQMDMTVRTLGFVSGTMDPNRWQAMVGRTLRLTEQIADLKMALEDGPQGEVGPAVPTKGRDSFRQQDRQQLRYALDALIGIKGDRTRVIALAYRMSEQANRLAAAIEARDQDTFLDLGQQVQQTWDAFVETLGLEKDQMAPFRRPVIRRDPPNESGPSGSELMEPGSPVDEAQVQEE